MANHCGNDKSRARPYVRRHNRGSLQRIHTGYHSQIAIEPNHRPQAAQLGHVGETIRVDRFLHRADTVCAGENRDDLCLHVCGKPRVLTGHEMNRLDPVGAGDLEVFITALDLGAARFENIQDGAKV